MIRLEQITGKNIWDILKLEVGEDQKNFVAPNDRSIIEAYVAITRNGQAFPFGIFSFRFRSCPRPAPPMPA